MIITGTLPESEPVPVGDYTLEVWTPADVGDTGADPRALAMADDLARADRDAVLLWLRHSGVTDRVSLAAKIMVGSVYAQAALLGLVDCGHCGDLGCGWCRGALS